MAIQSVQIDPSAAPDQTGDEIISAINSGSSSITRESALNQDALNIVKTGPQAGEHKVKNIQRQPDGLIDIEYDDVPEE
jgi:predicted membrane-bound spermidine synthase